MSDAVFRDVGHALHVAFLMEIMAAGQKGAMEMLKGVASRTKSVGLTPLEFRGECAFVRAEVERLLPPVEVAVIWARFGHQATRAAGVHVFGEWVLPSLPGTPAKRLVHALTWACFAPGRTSEWSNNALAREYAVRRQDVAQHKRRILAHSVALEARAQSVLHDEWVTKGTIRPEDVAVSA